MHRAGESAGLRCADPWDGPWADATYGLGAGEISSFTDADSGISVQVVAAEAGGAYRVRVKR